MIFNYYHLEKKEMHKLLGYFWEKGENIENLIHSEDSNTLNELNRYFYQKYSRHPVILDSDKHDFFDPNCEIFKMFEHVGKDVGTNSGNVRLVTYNGKQYVLKHRLTYVYDRTDEAREKWRYEGCLKEMEMSYLFEDLKIQHTRQIHHIFVKREFFRQWQNYQNVYYVLMEYVPGDSVLHFDYGVRHNKHKPGRKLTINAAKTFMIEVFEVFQQLLKANILPRQFDDSNIIMEYKNNKITWKLVNYSPYEINPKKVDADDCRWQVSNMKSMFTWRVCEYTGHSNPENHNPMWSELEKKMVFHYEYFSNIQNQAYNAGKCKGFGDWPEESLTSLVTFSEDILNFLRQQ